MDFTDLNFIIIVIMICAFVTSCSSAGEIKVSNSISTKIDTLNVGYLNSFLTGKQLFPIVDSNKYEDLLDEKILLSFESDNYYYVFYNTTKENDILLATYWDKLMPKYINFSYIDGLNQFRYAIIDYSDGPFLTGFYNSKDSIIITGSKLDRMYIENKDRFQVNYFSTTDTLLKLDKDISIGNSLDDVLLRLQVPDTFIKKKELELVLMEANTRIDNAWYINFPDYCSDYTNAIILSFVENKLVRIQYCDFEYTEFVFKKKSILTKDIHYN